MRVLLKTNLRRYFTHPLFWLAMLFSAGAGVMEVYFSLGSDLFLMLDDFTFLLVLFAQAILLAVIVTSQYKDGVFRNKVIAGNPKGRIFLAELLAALPVSAALFAACMLPICIMAYRPLRELPAARLLAAAGVLLLIFFSFAALTVFLCSRMRGRILAMILCFGAVFLLYALSYTCNDYLHAPEMLEIVLDDPSTDGSVSVTSTGQRYSSVHVAMPPETGAHWNAEDQLVDQSGNLLDLYGEPLDPMYKPIVRISPNPQYVSGPARIILSVIDCLNPVRPMDAATSQYCYEKNADTTEEMLKQDQQYRDLQFELLPQYLPWQLGVFAALGILGWLLFRRKELV